MNINTINNKRSISLVLFLLIITSCVSHRRIDYFQGTDLKEIEYSITTPEIQLVKPGDQLYIRASSFDDISYNFFGAQTNVNQMNFSNESSISLVSYLVNDSGYINYPIVGPLYVKDLNENEVAEKLSKILNSYFNQPTVIVKKISKYLVVLGEVRMPGKYYFTQNRISIFEGLSLAGDITIHGNKNEIIILRDKNNTVKKWTMDLTSDAVITSPQFYLESGDIIYVKSRKTALWSITTSSVSLILSSITTLILILNYIQN